MRTSFHHQPEAQHPGHWEPQLRCLATESFALPPWIFPPRRNARGYSGLQHAWRASQFGL